MPWYLCKCVQCVYVCVCARGFVCVNDNVLALYMHCLFMSYTSHWLIFLDTKTTMNRVYLILSYSWWARALAHYDDVTLGAIASLITSLTIVYSTVYSDADQRKHQSSASLAFVWGMAGSAENVSIWWRHHDHPVICDHSADYTAVRFLLFMG